MIDLTDRTLLNRYHVLSLIGQGGMADVYKVWDNKRSTYLALKLLREDFSSNKSFLRYFEQEAHALTKLQHPNIVRFYALRREGMLAFMLMDFVEGASLQAEIFNNRGYPLSLKRILEIMRPVCSALNFAHCQKIVHCDVKPANIMLEKGGRVLLADFGIAHMAGIATPVLSLAGTPQYMSPEQVLGYSVILQTDIYALGIVLFEMLTGGKRPFTGEQAGIGSSTNERVRWEQINLPPPSPRLHNSNVLPEIEAIALRCLEKDPYRRYYTALELSNALSKIMMDSLESSEKIVAGNGEKTTVGKRADQERTGQAALSDISPALKAWFFVGAVVLFLAVGFVAVRLNQWNAFWQVSNPVEESRLPLQSNARPVTTAQPTGTFVDDDTPANLSGDYLINSCMTVLIEGLNMVSECVTGITVFSNGQMQFHFSWTVRMSDRLELSIEPAAGNSNMYLTDNLGNRYDHTQVGGDASREVTLQNGESATGWFLFPAPVPAAKYFIFHDEDNAIQTRPIQRIWP